MDIFIESKIKELENAVVGTRSKKVIIYLKIDTGARAISFEDFMREALEEQKRILLK